MAGLGVGVQNTVEEMKKEFDKHARYTRTHEYGAKSWQIEKIRHKIKDTLIKSSHCLTNMV